jgi:tetratricopeptide (TPR) repeat protein
MASHAARTNSDLLKFIYSKWAAREEYLLSRYKSCINLSAASRQALVRLTGNAALTKQDIKARLFEISNLFMTGQYAQVRKHLDMLLKSKSTLMKHGQLAETLSYHELYLWIKGNLQGAAKMAHTILALDIKDKKRETFIREHTRLASLYLALGQYRTSSEHNEIRLRKIPEEDFEMKVGTLAQPGPGAWARMAEAYAHLGALKESRACFNSAYSCLESTSDYFAKTYLSIHLAYSLLSQGKNQEASRLLTTAHEYCKKADASLLKPYVLTAYGLSLARLGDKNKGVDLCKQALLQAVCNKTISGIARFEIWYAEALMAQGDYPLARQFLRRAVASAGRYKESGHLVYAYTLLALCYMEQPVSRQKSAASYARYALTLARKLQMKSAEDKVLSLLQENRVSQKLRSFSA